MKTLVIADPRLPKYIIQEDVQNANIRDDTQKPIALKIPIKASSTLKSFMDTIVKENVPASKIISNSMRCFI